MPLRRTYQAVSAQRRGRIGIVLAWFLVTRTLALAATHLGAAAMTPARHAQWDWTPGKSDLFPGPPPPSLIAPTVRWEANFYVTLARDGYPDASHTRPVYAIAFFPLYPLLVRALRAATHDTFTAAFALSNLCCLLAALLMLALGASRATPAAGLNCALLLLANPGSNFFEYPYPEALFVMLLCAAFLAMERDRPLAAGVAGAFASATRSAGVVVALALAIEAFRQRRSPPKLIANTLAALLALGGVAAFAFFCHQRYGDALAFAHIQRHYSRNLTLLGPLKALLTFNVDPDYYAITFAALGLGAWMLLRQKDARAFCAAFLTLLPMSTGTLKAMIRYQGANVPALTAAGQALSGRKFQLLLAGSLAWMLVEAFLFGKGLDHY